MAKAILIKQLTCDKCGNEINICHKCEQYIKPDDMIICTEKNHYHRGCYI